MNGSHAHPRTLETAGRLLVGLVLLLIPGSGAATPSGEYREPWSLVAGAGPTVNDLEVGGVQWIGYVATEWRPATSYLVLEFAVRGFSYTSADERAIVLPEAGIQVEGNLGFVQPYLGAGCGLAWMFREGRQSTVDGLYYLAGGIRWYLSRAVFLRTEARLRSLEPIGEGTLGVGWVLP